MTGKGNATKNEMIASARQKGFNPETDDEADAIAVILLALKDLINSDKKTCKSSFGSFQALGDSGFQAPITSLASELFQWMTGPLALTR